MNQLTYINLISFRTIAMRELHRIIRIWPQTIIPPVITTALYFVIFGRIMGSRIGSMDNVAFISYLVPGLIMMAIINNAYANVSSSFFSSKFQRNIEEILVSPTNNLVVVVGYCAGGMFRGLMIGCCVYLVYLIFVYNSLHSFVITISICVLTAMLFSLAGFINGLFAKKFDDISIIPTFILTPMIYLGGIFYSIEMLPKFWQTVTLINPIFYMVNAMRYGMLGESDINISTAIVVILGFIILLFSISLKLMSSGWGIRQ